MDYIYSNILNKYSRKTRKNVQKTYINQLSVLTVNLKSKNNLIPSSLNTQHKPPVTLCYHSSFLPPSHTNHHTEHTHSHNFLTHSHSIHTPNPILTDRPTDEPVPLNYTTTTTTFGIPFPCRRGAIPHQLSQSQSQSISKRSSKCQVIQVASGGGCFECETCAEELDLVWISSWSLEVSLEKLSKVFLLKSVQFSVQKFQPKWTVHRLGALRREKKLP